MAAKGAADMQVHWHILKTTAFLGVPTERGFCAEGTCFFLSVTESNLDFIYLVTCAHVVQPFLDRRSNNPNPEKIYLRMNRKAAPPKVEPTIRGDWISHSSRSVDVCVYPFPRDEWDADDQLSISPINYDSVALTPDRFAQFGFSLADEVFIVGAFIGRVGDKNNIPIIRVATMAAMAEEPVWGGSATRPAFLLETKSLGGISGSPFFLNTRPGRQQRNWGLAINKKDQVEAPYLLVGMMQGIHSGQYARDFIVSDQDHEKIVPKDADFNAGIAIGLPIELVKEVLDKPELKEARMATIRAKQKDSGYKPASAKPSEEPGEDANPHHLEDFKRLVDVAARKRPQGDQT
jgi:hypothetical protein